MYSWECDSETMSFSPSFGQNEARNGTQLPLYLFFSIFEQDSALTQREGDLMTPHLLNLVHVAVRSRFEGAQTYGHTRIYVCILLPRARYGRPSPACAHTESSGPLGQGDYAL